MTLLVTKAVSALGKRSQTGSVLYDFTVVHEGNVGMSISGAKRKIVMPVSIQVSSTVNIGTQLKVARGKLGLSLRQVEERTHWIAEEWGNPDYRISASWLDRVERENRGLSATKLIVLAFVYGLTFNHMLQLCCGVNAGTARGKGLAVKKPVLMFESGRLNPHDQERVPDSFMPAPPPENTILLETDPNTLPPHHRRVVIGSKDRMMEPMLLAGSVVVIDTLKRTIAKRKDWTNEFDRPIYVIYTRQGYSCGFCDLDDQSHWLTLVPHMLSPETRTARWRYRKDVQVMGTVTSLSTPRRSGRVA